MWRKLTLTLIVCFFLLTRALAADLPLVDVNLNPVPFAAKLTQQTVRQSFQDSRGTLWFVTQEGLNKYNGHELQNFKHSAQNPNSLPTNYVTRIAEAKNGEIWLSTFGAGLARFNSISNSFEVINSNPNDHNTPYSNNINTIFADNRGYIWIGYLGGFSQFNPKNRTFHHFISGDNDIPLTGEVTGFTQSSDGDIWAATELSGLLRIYPREGTVRQIQHTPDSKTSILPGAPYRITADIDGNIWIAFKESGVSRFDPRSETSSNFVHDEFDPTSLSSNKTTDIYTDLDGNIWIATFEGLNLFSKEKNKFVRYTQKNANIPENLIVSIYQTREKKYWVGTMSGLASGMKTDFQKYDQSQGNLSNNSVNSFAETRDGSLWVATDDGLNRLHPNQESFTWINESTAPAISQPRVMSLFDDGDSLWIGTFDGGLNRLNLDTSEVVIYRHSRLRKDSIGANGVTSMLRTSTGELLIGTYGGGLSLYQEETDNFLNFQHDPTNPRSISNDEVLTLLEDSLGQIWIGTGRGLNRFHPEEQTFDQYFADTGSIDGLSSDMPWYLWEDSEGTLWIASAAGGISLWRREHRSKGILKIERLPATIQLPSSNIYGIQGDNAGWVWLSHGKGLTRINPETLEAHQYGVRDGLQAAEFTLGASYKSKDGTIYFGGTSGFNTINASELRSDRVPPTVAISQIKVMNQRREFDAPYHALESIDLGYEDRMLAVEFFAADYSSPDLINYAYKLEGINPEWVVSPDSRIASFTTLPPGSHMLKLAAASPDGTWNWNAVSIPVNVAAPPWRSPVAYGIYTGIAAAIVAYYFYRQRRQAHQALLIQRELENRVDERTRDLEEARKVAEEATKAKSDFLATMSHEIRTPMHGIIGMTELLLHTGLNNQQKQFASAAHRSGESLLVLINEILDFSKVEASKVELEAVEFDLISLIDDICYLQGEPASRKGLNLNSICHPDIPDKLIGDPTKIRQVIMNLVSNSIKFTAKGNVTVRIEPKFSHAPNNKALVYICVEDDGIGMDKKTQEKVFEPFTQADTSTTREYGGTGLGLSISRHYIDLMGGDIVVTSAPDEGTKITVSVPLGMPENVGPRLMPFLGMTSEVLTENDTTFEMVATHLACLGVKSKQISLSELEQKPRRNCSVIIVDNSELEVIEDSSGLLSQLECECYILLKNFHSATDTLGSQEWVQLEKPTTLQALTEALRFRSPISSNHGDLAPSQLSQPQTHPEAPNRPRVLVAEDIETNQRIIMEMLRLLGYRVDIAGNGRLALEMFKQEKYALVFMDCQMPVLDGYAATKAMREYETELGLTATPIVAITAGFDDKDQDRCKQAGMSDYINKPFSLSDIKASLSKYVGFLGEHSNASTSPSVSITRKSDKYSEQDTEREILSASAIESIRDIERQTGRSILPSIFEGYNEQMREKLEELHRSIQSNDCNLLYKTAHAIKSMSANIGAERVRHLGSTIERLGREGSITGVESMFADLVDAYAEFSREFKEMLIE